MIQTFQRSTFTLAIIGTWAAALVSLEVQAADLPTIRGPATMQAVAASARPQALEARSQWASVELTPIGRQPLRFVVQSGRMNEIAFQGPSGATFRYAFVVNTVPDANGHEGYELRPVLNLPASASFAPGEIELGAPIKPDSGRDAMVQAGLAALAIRPASAEEIERVQSRRR